MMETTIYILPDDQLDLDSLHQLIIQNQEQLHDIREITLSIDRYKLLGTIASEPLADSWKQIRSDKFALFGIEVSCNWLLPRHLCVVTYQDGTVAIGEFSEKTQNRYSEMVVA